MAGLVWTLQLVAVVGGHMVGAWAGHARIEARAGAPRPRTGEIPLALVMVALTTLTLWSLGQAIVVDADAVGRLPGPSSVSC